MTGVPDILRNPWTRSSQGLPFSVGTLIPKLLKIKKACCTAEKLDTPLDTTGIHELDTDYVVSHLVHLGVSFGDI